ncbi:39S ribosomal protein L44, mitochondrial [Apophysomyces ossiformis]|uniref:Large ribosomal subunit protein mL53 n=1 Tax=Apophysomyces ossiformis TaxID=679940 RepID=A0A8H7ERW7_9FUNG|nr:39S ribosomal protein L44, mitochondrial [Apophysomyces ossiformis]
MLVKHITEIKLALSPFNVASKSSRLFLNRINTNEARKINPTIKIQTNVLNDPTAPSHLHITYRDGKQLEVSTDKLKIDNIMQLVNKHAKKLEEAEQANAW